MGGIATILFKRCLEVLSTRARGKKRVATYGI